jgi:hypothetical protein
MKDEAMTPTRKSSLPGLIRTDPVALAVWARLTTAFATWRFVVLSGFTRRSLQQFANDQLTPLTKAVHWKVGLGLLGGLDDRQVEFLTVYAQLNADRVERVFRLTSLALVTLPVAAAVAASEIDPGVWARYGVDPFGSFAFVLTTWLGVSGIMLAAAWRARDLADLLIFEQARRQLARAERPVQP